MSTYHDMYTPARLEQVMYATTSSVDYLYDFGQYERAVDKRKCEYCGQYANRYDECAHCGAPANG